LKSSSPLAAYSIFRFECTDVAVSVDFYRVDDRGAMVQTHEVVSALFAANGIPPVPARTADHAYPLSIKPEQKKKSHQYKQQ
jgi:hypothetical protein